MQSKKNPDFKHKKLEKKSSVAPSVAAVQSEQSSYYLYRSPWEAMYQIIKKHVIPCFLVIFIIFIFQNAHFVTFSDKDAFDLNIEAIFNSVPSHNTFFGGCLITQLILGSCVLSRVP